MNILIAFATNSGSTQAGAGIVADMLRKHSHAVTVKYVSEIKPEDISSYDSIVFGSPSWDYEGTEGQPHEDMISLLKQLTSEHVAGKKIALFSMGDKSYTHFGGAVDVMEQYLRKLHTVPIVVSLRVDSFFSNPDASDLVTEWAEKIASIIQ